MTDDPFERAIARDRHRRDDLGAAAWRVHAFWYVVVNLLLAGIWFFSADPFGSAYPWFVWPLLGWGSGLASHWWITRRDRTT